MKKKIYYFLRRIKYKFTKGISIGKGGKIVNTKMMPFSSVGSLSVVHNSVLGKYTSIGRNATIHNTSIGNFCSISWNVTIGATSHPLTYPSTHAFSYISRFQFVANDQKIVKYCIIGSDVWIGTNAIILSGVNIGNGAVIGAGSIVTKDVKPYHVVVSAPAKSIKIRFSEKVIIKLEKIKWWDWKYNKIKLNLDFFQKELSEASLELLAKDEK